MYKTFDFLKKIYFERISGSKQELKAAKLIKDECKKFGVNAKLEKFPVDAYEIKKAVLKFSKPSIEVEFVGVGMSGNTPKGGVDGQLVYISSTADAMIKDIKDKICLIPSKIIAHSLYKVLVEKKPAALILCTGDVYRDEEEVDLDPYKYRSRHYELGKIPAVCIRMKDAERIVEIMPKQAHIELIQEEYKVESQNVVAEIKGSKYPDEIVVFSAHYDSVPYSKGAYDNGTGVICIMELLAYYSKHKPLRTVRFVWCGSEEEGLLGSKAYVQRHEKELDKIMLNINVDMVAVTLGYDIAVVSAEQALVDYIKYISKKNGFAINVKQGVYSSDSTPFADNGVPALSFARSAFSGGATIHSRRDVIERLSKDNYYKTCQFIEQFSDDMVNAALFPVNREIPDKVKEDLDYYMLRKERKE